MKKLFLILLFISIGSTTFTLDLSVGGGNVLGFEFKNYKWENISQSGMFVNFGTFGFFDFQYGEVALNTLIGLGTYNYYRGAKYTVSMDVFGKYPFYIGKNILYPLVGINGGFDRAMDFYLNIVGGIGVDHYWTQRLFLRIEAAYAGTVISRLRVNDKRLADALRMKYSAANNAVVVKIGVGFKLR